MAEAQHRKLLLGALIVGGGLLISAASWSVFRYGVEGRKDELPVLSTLPAFTLTDSSGRQVTQADLRGGIWVADFIFTQCPNVCPALSAQMALLRRQLDEQGQTDVRLVSISVDPAHDTPAVLQAYADRFHADPQRWLFMTGERDALHALVGKGFQLAVAERPAADNTDGMGLITHSDRFVLVDGDLNIRAYYHGQDGETVQQVVKDVRRLSAATAHR